MYKINKREQNGLSYIDIVAERNISAATICLNWGAALQMLTLESLPVIEDLHPLAYEDTYASSLLFPFVNRIKDGEYTYKGLGYKFECNEIENHNALHGLVFDKTFACVNSDLSNDQASVTLSYSPTSIINAFPYLFALEVTYVLTPNSLEVKVKVENVDTQTFPFTLGWHPYFLSDDLYNSRLEFKATNEYQFDERMITKGHIRSQLEMPFEINDKMLDHCYALSDSSVLFETPKYKMTLSTSGQDNYFQIYTPPKKNTIALEPVTGVSDSFNNKIGLRELKPKENYTINWRVSLNKK
ncbi:aldose 1-epimerase [Wenyingzhuangia sp.]|uniref:aldose 1-epimerase n=1 Tax=Wenyingzhuangia sp. TaxID=1964193 RepID=UPI00321A22FC